MNTTTNQTEISFIPLGEDGLFAQFIYNGAIAYYDKSAVLHLLSDSDTTQTDRETLNSVLAAFNSIDSAFGNNPMQSNG